MFSYSNFDINDSFRDQKYHFNVNLKANKKKLTIQKLIY